jgi:hypothetical protein
MANTEATLLLRIKQSGKEVLDATAASLASIGQVALAAFGAVAAGAGAALAAYKEQEDATRALNQAMIQQGVYSKDLSDQYLKMASALQQQSTFGDEAIVSAEAQIQSMIGQTRISEDLMKATLDLAAAKKIDLSSAANIVGKAIANSTDSLARYGVKVEDSADKNVRMANTIKGLERAFGGQAEAAAGGLGALEQMQNNLGDILEVVGERLAPAVTAGAKAFSQFALELQGNENFLQGVTEVVRILSKAATIAATSVMGLGSVLGQVLGTTMGAIALAVDGQWRAAFQAIKDGAKGTGDFVSSEADLLTQRLDGIDQAFLSKKEETHAKEREMIRSNNEQKKAIQDEEYARFATDFDARSEDEIAKLMAQNQLKGDMNLVLLNRQIADEQNQSVKLQLELQKRKMLDDAYTAQKIANMTLEKQIQAALESEKVKTFEGGLNELSKLQNSKSKELVAIGKAAAIAQIGIDTARGAMSAYSAMAMIPLVGPALGYAAAGAVIAYGAERIANVAGVQLAEGGIVQATPGGVPAIIGEGGRDEAVIPLEDGAPAAGIGQTTIHMNVYGGLLGDEATALEFARAVDENLLKLRRNGQSLAFDTRTI